MINKPRIYNLISQHKKPVANQIVIEDNEKRVFQSYKSIIVIEYFDGRKTEIHRDWDYSTTTGKYRNQFLGETKAETLAKLKSGEYVAIGWEVK